MVVGLKHAGSDESRIESRSPEPVGNSVVNPDPFWIRFGSVFRSILDLNSDPYPNTKFIV